MYLYNIHTHKIVSNPIDDYQVRYILNTSPSEFENLNNITGDCSFSCGVHPWYSQDADSQIRLLTAIATDPRIVAIGEAGLDKLQGAALRIQTEVFRRQIELAIQVQKPLIIHCVKAWDELIALYKEYKSSVSWIIHGYRGNPQQAKQLADLGFKFSIGEKFNKDALSVIPIASLFCETDISDIPIYSVYKNIAEALHIDINELIDTIAYSVNQTFYKR